MSTPRHWLRPGCRCRRTGRSTASTCCRASPVSRPASRTTRCSGEPVGSTQLFNLKDDLGEKTDLAAKESAKLKELEGIYAAWDKQMMAPLWVRQDARRPGPKKEEPKADDTIATRFKQLDTNGDGKLSAEELKKATPAVQKRLDGADKDKDGFLTLAEVQAHLGGAAPPAKQPEVAPPPRLKCDLTPTATYDWGYIYGPKHPVPAGQRLTGCRDIEPSPFPADGGRVFYFAGYDGGVGPGHNTAWIYRGELPNPKQPTTKEK